MRCMMLFFVIFLVGCQAAVTQNNVQTPTDTDSTENTVQGNDNMMTGQDTVTFKLEGENFRFLMDGKEAPELKVKKGTKVKIELTSIGGFHDWVIDEFNAATDRVNEGQTNSIEFVADKVGTFEYYCSVGRHREFGMKGNLVVE